MRFDNMIGTVLGRPADRPDRVAASWRQLVDLVAQHRGGGEAKDRAFAFLRTHRPAVGSALRLSAARALTGLSIDPDILAFFAEDRAEIAAPLIGGAALSADEWVGLLPRLGPAARALLRHRRDLAPKVNQALAAFGHSDFALHGTVAPAEQSADGPAAAPPAGRASQISELVQRIEQYRRRPKPPPVPQSESDPGEPALNFRWESGTDGTISWVEGAPRGSLIGLSISAMPGPGGQGVDGQAAGAFEKKSPFRDARFAVGGEGPSAGDWRISGVPWFDPARGSFRGYRGTARRPRSDETAQAAQASSDSAGLMGTRIPAESLRSLIHELRTPLNAIIGFAEMIEGQYLGPAGDEARDRAVGIVGQARRLLEAVEDLDAAARIETRRFERASEAVDAAALLVRLLDSYSRVVRQRGAELASRIANDLPRAAGDPPAVERMIARLLAATLGLASAGEALKVSLDSETRAGRPVLRLDVGRPRAIAELDENALLDPGNSPEGDWPDGPVLGLGFALRLVRNLAEAAGGRLQIGPDRISLILPTVQPGRAGGEMKDRG